jgi:RNA polymerase sigma-70 factor (ECF subfamily)
LQAADKNIHADLIERCRAGDRAAHFRIYQLYRRAMFNTAFRVVGNAEEAEDVLQEAFLAAFRGLEFYRADAPFGAWLKRIVVNKAITLLKKRRWERLPDDDRFDVPEESPEPEVDGLTVERVKRAMDELPDGYRAVLSLYLLEGYDHAEIADILGITESTSKSQYNRSKKRLREILESKK